MHPLWGILQYFGYVEVSRAFCWIKDFLKKEPKNSGNFVNVEVFSINIQQCEKIKVNYNLKIEEINELAGF